MIGAARSLAELPPPDEVPLDEVPLDEVPLEPPAEPSAPLMLWSVEPTAPDTVPTAFDTVPPTAGTVLATLCSAPVTGANVPHRVHPPDPLLPLVLAPPPLPPLALPLPPPPWVAPC